MFQMGLKVNVELEGQPSAEVAVGTRVRDLPISGRDARGLAHIGASVNNDIVTLSYPLEVDCRVRPLTMADRAGWRIYRNSVSFMLAKVVRELFPGAEFAVEHSLGSGFYCSFALPGRAPGIAPEEVNRIERCMRELVGRDAPIERRKISFERAVEQFQADGQRDKYDLLRFLNPPKIAVYACEDFMDLAHGVLADRTGALEHFRLLPHPPGFVLQFPEREAAPAFAPFEPQPHLFQIFSEHKEWGRILGLRTVGDLNRAIAERNIADLIRIAEAFHEKKIARIADHVLAHRDRIRWILIAGPSSSGKTTFSKRLMVQLRVNGLRPVTISVDDYFVDRAHTPRDERGEPDFEHIETVDLPLFNEHLATLDRGGEVSLPTFDFAAGARQFRGRSLRLDPDQIVIIEGIHALNPRLTAAVPAEHKFKIYISALTQLNLDYHNRIATTDNRLLRRIVRDSMFRGNNAVKTLEMWPSVRRGERRWIFPFQREADVAFNSALDYELAVLKPFVEPLLKEVKPHHESYGEARRLMQFLDSFIPTRYDPVPPNSILREFIGRSTFRY
mgnify:CR=1 FL=1